MMLSANETLPKLIMVIPCYNEEKVLPIMAPVFKKKIEELISSKLIRQDSRILFVNDGSRDNTWSIISDLAKQSSIYSGISLSRNRGHQNALLAGLMEAKERCDITVSIDCDGQDDINAVNDMIKEYHNGAEIVYGVRNNRETDSFFKRTTAQGYYRLMNLMGVELVYNHADYRLVSSRALKAFSDFREVNIFLRGMFPLVGFKSTSVYYKRESRVAGESHYPLSKMIALAADGITSLSIKPIRYITGFGIVISLVSFCLVIYTLISYFSGNTVPGWSSNMIAVCLFGGIQLIALGVIGEYVGKMYLETKGRPRFIISEKTGEEQE